MRRVVVALVVGLALAIPAAASARVHLVSRTSPVRAGTYATLTEAPWLSWRLDYLADTFPSSPVSALHSSAGWTGSNGPQGRLLS